MCLLEPLHLCVAGVGSHLNRDSLLWLIGVHKVLARRVEVKKKHLKYTKEFSQNRLIAIDTVEYCTAITTTGRVLWNVHGACKARK